ncbi:hypothetical protein KP79_PYT20434 [Mizuhopecten yessoensis]|uniref:Uncharacterized protein n=2 Tax=Mizuhopecten yessoensis TaxID=6573 RepID=A0A210PIU0_MIZYE|nr:hypothetical protein KP79_PYT20434 [Mizuhopecten yessoensis]
MENDITFVTAYFYIETFKKGEVSRGIEHYLAWLEGFSKFDNDLIAFTDSHKVKGMLQRARMHLPSHKTKIYFINKGDMWAFNLAPEIKSIFAQPGYPKHSPNTIIEQYSCAMHAKYELMETVIRERMFRTKYLAWIDIGYFRFRYEKHFKLQIPPDFRDDHIAFGQINAFKPHTALTVIREDAVWVAGGMFIGRPEYLMVFIEDYRLLVESLIARRLMGTDQNLLYIMYIKNEHVFPRIPVQTYSDPFECDWFYLGNYCRYVYETSLTARQRRNTGRGKLLSVYQQYL